MIVVFLAPFTQEKRWLTSQCDVPREGQLVDDLIDFGETKDLAKSVEFANQLGPDLRAFGADNIAVRRGSDDRRGKPRWLVRTKLL